VIVKSWRVRPLWRWVIYLPGVALLALGTCTLRLRWRLFGPRDEIMYRIGLRLSIMGGWLQRTAGHVEHGRNDR